MDSDYFLSHRDFVGTAGGLVEMRPLRNFKKMCDIKFRNRGQLLFSFSPRNEPICGTPRVAYDPEPNTMYTICTIYVYIYNM